jgi:hypothetical protein
MQVSGHLHAPAVFPLDITPVFIVQEASLAQNRSGYFVQNKNLFLLPGLHDIV